MHNADPCFIRPVRSADLELILSWRNDPSVRKYMLTQGEISLDEHRAWFEKASSDPSKRILLVENGDHVPFGYVGFSNVAKMEAADWGFYVMPGAEKGSGRKLCVAALDFAFRELGVHKVCGQVLDYNRASISIHEKLGFQEEGVLREQCRIGDRYYNLVCFGLLSHDWIRESQ